MQTMAEESVGFTPAGQSGLPPSASTSATMEQEVTTTTTTTTTATTATTAAPAPAPKSSSASPTTQTQAQTPPPLSTHKNNTNNNNDIDTQSPDLEDNHSDRRVHTISSALHSQQKPIASQASGSHSAEPPSLPLLSHQRQTQTSVSSPDPAPDSGLASPLNAVVEDEPRTRPTTRHAPRHNSAATPPRRPSSPPPGSSTSGITTSSPPYDHLKRSATYPQETPSKEDNVDHQTSAPTADVASPPPRRAPASRSSFGIATADAPPPSLRTQRAQAAAAECYSSRATTPETLSPRDSRDSKNSQGQRELLLLKSLSHSSPPDERRASTHRPPVSYKPPANASAQNATTPVRVPPIRSFRSSGSRKSLTLDMNYRPRYDSADEPSDTSYDRTLRALEGRHIQDMLSQMTPPTSGRREVFESDDSGDVFLKIASEEGPRRNANENPPDETQSSVSRVYRSHRRPLSTNLATYHPKSPPRISRRLSDQQERSRSRHDDDRASEVTRSMTHRVYPRDQKAASVHPGEDLYRSRTGATTLRPSPLTPRSLAFQDSGPENPIHSRRRSSVTDQNTTPPVRTSTYKSGSGHAYGKSYNSSPLGLEGTESTASTTAPSTVWDELDDLKSRIHRLELTGKLPSTSAAAVSRFSDERPPTATTTVTTMSSSPKRSGNREQQNESTVTSASQKEAYPILHSALSKSKPFLSQDIYRALETAANDAMALATLMGQPGQPGPISSGASTIGSGTTVTDRQLRRKADSVCRSLTELCVALGEDVAHGRPAQSGHAQKSSQSQSQTQYHPSPQAEGPSTPTISKSLSGLQSRRPSIVADNLPKTNTSPNRALSKFEERRNTILNGSSLPSPRVAGSNPTTPQDTVAHRRSSLLISRTRRAATEEPEESSGRKSSLLLRSRRGGTEEPEEGRQTSMLRSRRGTIGEGEDDREPRFSAPSRAYTEVNATRGSTREYTEVAASTRPPAREYASHSQSQHQSQAATQDSPSNPPSALPRRRFVSSNVNGSRLATPATPSALPTRTYLERSAPAPAPAPVHELDAGKKPTESRPQRYYSLGQGMSLNRTASLSMRRANRDSTITNASTTATAGGYR